MAELQVELLKVQNWVKAAGERIIVIFEGRDAAGKGGTIKRSWNISTRAAHEWSRSKADRSRKDTVVLPAQHRESSVGRRDRVPRSLLVQSGRRRARHGFLHAKRLPRVHAPVPDLERMFVRSGIRLFKYWFSVTREEQRRRFESRDKDPLKQWKLSPIDKASLDKWDDYTEAKEAMFFYTTRPMRRGTIIKSDDKKRARLSCMQHFLTSLPYPNKNRKVVTGPDPLIVGSTDMSSGADEHILGKSLAARQQQAGLDRSVLEGILHQDRIVTLG